jgi:hypothetical protein
MRYNRLLDIFTGVACYSLQNHLRTTVPDVGQVETDELYVGVDKNGQPQQRVYGSPFGDGKALPSLAAQKLII